MKKIYTLTCISPDGRICVEPCVFESIDDIFGYLHRFVESIPDSENYEVHYINDCHDNIVMYFSDVLEHNDFIYHYHINTYII